MDKHSLFHGCVRVEEKNGTFAPQRFTKEQCKQMRHYPQSIQMRIGCTAGVRLEFETAQPTVSFDFICEDFTREFVVFDIWEDDKYTESVFYPSYTTTGTVSYTCRSTPCRLSIYLPHMAKTSVHQLNLGNARPIKNKAKTILFYGDSLTQGMTAPRPSFSWTSIVADTLGAEMVNWGIGGKKFQADVLEQTKAVQPDAIVVAFGINDSLQEEETPCMGKNVPTFFKQLRMVYPETTIYAIAAPFIRALCMEDSVQEQLERVRTLTKLYAKEQGCTVIDGNALLQQYPFFITEDAHPNELGMQQIAQALLKQIPSI